MTPFMIGEEVYTAVSQWEFYTVYPSIYKSAAASPHNIL